MADRSIQFDLRRADPPRPTPAWLKRLAEWVQHLFAPVGRFLRRLSHLLPDAPFARILLWSVLAVAAVALAWALVVRLREGGWRLPRRRDRRAIATMPDEGEAEWTPAAAPARALLREADALASAGRYAEAVHLLLVRSVDDIARERPRLVRPALTSRELARAPALPARARALFADIARVVERSLFGGSPVDVAEWQAARTAYADFALPGAWAA